jgi:hypothetical protein
MSNEDQEPTPERRETIRRKRLRGEDRKAVRTAVVKAYEQERASIRALAGVHGLSFGLTRTLLLEGGVVLRDRRRTRAGAGR